MMARSAAAYCHPQLQAIAHKLVDEKGNPLAPVVNLTVSTPRLEDKAPRLTHVGAKKGDSARSSSACILITLADLARASGPGKRQG